MGHREREWEQTDDRHPFGQTSYVTWGMEIHPHSIHAILALHLTRFAKSFRVLAIESRQE